MATSSAYGSLRSSSTQIRLLRLLPFRKTEDETPGPWHDCANIECDLVTVDLERAPDYEALSYTWGEPAPTTQVAANGEMVPVRPNLTYALAALRSSEPRLLWIDALCINQDDVQERSHQVRLMGEIYRRAKRVLVWLGRPGSQWDSLVASAVRMATKIGQQSPESKLSPPPSQLGIEHEDRFDQWAKCQVSTSGQLALEGWSQMKKRRKRRHQLRQRIPEMEDELSSLEQFLAERRQELRQILDLEVQEKAIFDQMKLAEEPRQRQLEEPQRRLLQDFKERQEQALQEERIMSPPHLIKLRKVDQRQGPLRSGEVDELYRGILERLCKFQQSTIDLRREVGDTGIAAERRKSRLESLEKMDKDQRRGLWGLRDQMEAWQRLEDEQTREFLELHRSHDGQLESTMQRWESEQNIELHDCGNPKTFLLEQYQSLQTLTRKQRQTLESLRWRMETLWEGSPCFDPNADSSLTDKELRSLAGAKDHKRQILRQLLVLRDVELRKLEVESVLQQYDKAQEKVYNLSREVPSARTEIHITREESMAAQAHLVRYWDYLRIEEAKGWETSLFRSANTNTPDDFPDLDLLSLSRICGMEYWSRLWIVQEVLLAKELVLCFGDNARTTSSWEILNKARCSLDRIPSYWEFRPAIGVPLTSIRNALPFQLDRLRECSGRSWPMHRLMKITEKSLCQDPKDKIYGLLGLANDCCHAGGGGIDVDYSKPIEDVYRDAIRWYHHRHGGDRGYPSLFRFSEVVQLSFKGQREPQSLSDTPIRMPLLVIPSSVSAETFCLKGMLRGAVLPVEHLLEDHELVRLRRQDWIHIMVDYLDNSGLARSKWATEKELVHLDSIVTPLAISTPSSSVCTVKKSQFFIIKDGGFGIASTAMREDDQFCQFGDSPVGVILRPSGDGYDLVSRAILPEGNRMGGDQAAAGAESRAVHVMLGAALLQQLTVPVDLSVKHASREALYIHEASFGWSEFISLGLGVDPTDASPRCTAEIRPTSATSNPEKSVVLIKNKEPEVAAKAMRSAMMNWIFSSFDDNKRAIEFKVGVNLEFTDSYRGLDAARQEYVNTY